MLWGNYGRESAIVPGHDFLLSYGEEKGEQEINGVGGAQNARANEREGYNDNKENLESC